MITMFPADTPPKGGVNDVTTSVDQPADGDVNFAALMAPQPAPDAVDVGVLQAVLPDGAVNTEDIVKPASEGPEAESLVIGPLASSRVGGAEMQANDRIGTLAVPDVYDTRKAPSPAIEAAMTKSAASVDVQSKQAVRSVSPAEVMMEQRAKQMQISQITGEADVEVPIEPNKKSQSREGVLSTATMSPDRPHTTMLSDPRRPNGPPMIPLEDGGKRDIPVTEIQRTAEPVRQVQGAPTPPTVPAVVAQTSARELLKQDPGHVEKDALVGLSGQDRPMSSTVAAAQVAHAPNPETARVIAQQISTAVIQNNGRATEIALNPEELGRVRMTLSANETVLTLTVLADRPETQELLRRHIDVLAQEFRSLGYQDITFTFGDGGQPKGSEDPSQDEANLPTGAVEQAQETQDYHNKSLSGLDLRL